MSPSKKDKVPVVAEKPMRADELSTSSPKKITSNSNMTPVMPTVKDDV